MRKLFCLFFISWITGCATNASDQSGEAPIKPVAEAPPQTKAAPQKEVAKSAKPAAPQKPPLTKAPAVAVKQEMPLTYMERIHKRILRKAELATDTPRSLEVTFAVTQSRDGEILTIKRKSSSGYPPYDAAMESAIRKSSPLPKIINEQDFKAELILSFRSNQSV